MIDHVRADPVSVATTPSPRTDEVSWPAPRARVRAEWDGGSMVARVMRPVDDLMIVLSIPDDRRHDELPGEDVATVLSWTDADGIWARPVRLGRVTFSLMTLVATGEATWQQRRRFYRAPVALVATLVDGHRKAVGTIHDLSEGGACLRVTGPAPLPHSRVTTRFTLDGRTLEVPGTVVRASDDRGGNDIGIAFGDLQAAIAGVIRREVFTVQVQSRRGRTSS